MDRDNAINKLRAAIAIANGAKTLGEAQAATEAINRLMQKYNIDLEEVTPLSTTVTIVKKIILMSGSNRDKASGRLADVLSRFNFVKMVWNWVQDANSGENLPVIELIGREENVEIVYHLYMVLRTRLNAIVNQEFEDYKASGGRQHGKSWKSSWLFGASAGIYNQLYRIQREFERTQFQKLNGTIGTGTEIIVSRSGEIEAYLKEHNYKLSPVKGRVSNEAAYKRGKAVGENLVIHSEIE